MVPANVKLSKNELLLVCDETFILTKNNIIDKVYKLFGMLSNDFAKQLDEHTGFPEPEIFTKAPKIYKGEQYKSLPYVMLDHPRYFSNNDAFAIRSLFWWGNFFSITLHLSGRYAAMYGPAVIKSLHENETGDWYYCISENQWQHHFETNNYIIFSPSFFEISKAAAVQKDFIKIARKIPLQQWDDVYDFYTGNFGAILEMIKL